MTMKEQILDALAWAEAVIIGDSPLLHFFPIMVDTDTGNLEFTWEEEGNSYEVVIPENNLDDAVVKPDGYNIKDKDGKIVALATYLLMPTWKKE